MLPGHNPLDRVPAVPAMIPADPNIAVLLLVAGMLSVYAEFCLPGRVLPGALGSAAVLLACTSLARHNLSWDGLSLAVFAVLCCGVEAVRPAKGLFAIAGALALSFGLIRLIHPPDPGPHIHLGPHIHVWVALLTGFTLVPASAWLLSVAHTARRKKRDGVSVPSASPSGKIV